MEEVSKIIMQTIKIHNKTTTTGEVTLVVAIAVAPSAEVPTVVAAAREVQSL